MKPFSCKNMLCLLNKAKWFQKKNARWTEFVEKSWKRADVKCSRALRHKTLIVTSRFTSLFFTERTSCAFIVWRKKFSELFWIISYKKTSHQKKVLLTNMKVTFRALSALTFFLIFLRILHTLLNDTVSLFFVFSILVFVFSRTLKF